MITINIFVKDCKYFLAYPKGLPYSYELGDCDFLGDTCSPHSKCPINTYLKKPHQIIEDYKPDSDISKQKTSVQSSNKPVDDKP